MTILSIFITLLSVLAYTFFYTAFIVLSTMVIGSLLCPAWVWSNPPQSPYPLTRYNALRASLFLWGVFGLPAWGVSLLFTQTRENWWVLPVWLSLAICLCHLMEKRKKKTDPSTHAPI